MRLDEMIWAHVLRVILSTDLGKSVNNSNFINYIASVG